MRSLLLAFLIVGTLVVGTFVGSLASAADPAFVGILSLTSDPDVAKELGLSDEVKKQLADITAKREDEAIQLALEIKDLTPEERKEKLAPFVAESEKQGLALLTDEQKTKLQQVRIRKLGMKGLLDPAIGEQVGLTKEQRGKIEVMHGLFELKQGLPEAERTAAAAKLERDILTLLDKDQRAKWESLSGRIVDLAQAPAEQPMDSRPGTGVGTGGSERPAGPTGPAPRTIVNSKPPGNTTLTPPKAPLKAGDPNVKLKFQFQYAPWKDVIEWFAEQADFSLVTDNYPPGTFNYSDSTRTYTPAQSIDLLNSVLITKGFRLVRKERMLFLLSAEDELPAEFYLRITEQDLDTAGAYEIATCQFQLNKITAEEAEVEVRKLISPQGKVVTLPKAQQIIVTETVGALKQVRNALKAIENPATPKDESVTVVQLENLRPSEFMLLARPLLGMADNQNVTTDASLRIAIDELGMRLLVTGKADMIAKVTEIKKLIDVSTGIIGEGGAPLEQPQLVIYSVDNADPMSVLQILQTLLAGIPDVRLTIDPKSGNLVAHCRPTQHATIRATLDELQRDATQYKTFKLRKNDPQAVTLQINELFGGSADKPSPNAPKVVADTTNLQILVRASPSQLVKIQDLLKEMGELGGTAVAAEGEVRPNMRFLPATSRTIESAIEQLEPAWTAVRPNKIRILRTTPAKDSVPGQLQNNLNPRDGRSSEDRRFMEEFGIPNDPGRPGQVPGNAPNPAPAPNLKDSTIRLRAPNRVQFVSQPAPVESANQPPASDTAAEETPASPKEKSKPGAEIVITITSSGIMIASEDLDALDEFEARLQQLIDQPRGKEVVVKYLKHAKAQVASTLLTEYMSGAPAASEGGSSNSLMGDLAAGMMGDMGGGLLGGLLGMGGGGGGSTTSSSSGLTIIPDIRLNALIITANGKDMETIEEFLAIIDVPSGPEPVQLNPAPRFIPVVNTTAESVANVVRSVYAGRLAADASGGGQQRQPSPEDFIRALRGGGRGGQQQQNKGEEQKMTVGVDSRTNSLVVVAPDYLFEEVKLLVKTLDVAELTSDTVVRVHSLKSANADVITRSLSQLYGDSITTSKTTNTATTTTRPGSTSGQRPGGQQNQRPGGQGNNQGGNNQQPNVSNQARQQMELFNALQRAGGGRGGFGGGGRGGR